MEEVSATHEPRPLPRPPTACGKCGTGIRRFVRDGDVWHPCADCGGALCEKCCGAAKAEENAE